MNSRICFSSCLVVLLIILSSVGTSSDLFLNQRSELKKHFFDSNQVIDISAVIEWNKTFGGSPSDGFVSVRQTSDNGFIITGYTYSYSQGKEDMWIVKTDKDGIEEWNVSFGGLSHDQGLDVIQTMDGNFIAVGQIYSEKTRSYDASMININSMGNIEWNLTISFNGSDCATSACNTSDNGYLIVVNSETAARTDCYLIKVDEYGKKIWEKSVGNQINTDMINGLSLIKAQDSGFLLTGQLLNVHDDLDGFLIKTDESSNVIWMKRYGGVQTDFLRSIERDENEYILCGTTKSYGSGNYDVWLLKVNEMGDEQWNTSLGGSSFEEGYAVQPALNEGYLIGGYTFSYGNGKSDAWILKTDEKGVEQWNQTFGGPSIDKAFSIQQINNDKYVIAGNINGDGWLSKIHIIKNKSLSAMFFIGSIKNLQTITDDVTQFTSKQVIAIPYSPIQVPQHLQNKSIIISNQYNGFLNSNFVFGLFQAIII